MAWDNMWNLAGLRMVVNNPFMDHAGMRLVLACLFLVIGSASCQQRSVELPTLSFVDEDSQPINESSAPPLPDKDNSLHFDHVTLEQGLSQSTVNAIIQDDQGFMWFGTNNGLNRYDGHEISVFKHDPSDANSLSDNHIQA